MAHRPGHQTIGASLGAFLQGLGQRQLAEGERSREEQRAEDLRLRVREERRGDVADEEERIGIRTKRVNQLAILRASISRPTSQDELTNAITDVRNLGFDIPDRVFTGPQSGRDFMAELRERIASQERIARGRVKPSGEKVDLPKQIDTTIKEFNTQRRNRQTGGEVDVASVRSARELLDAVPEGVVDEPRLAKFREEVEREEFRQIGDLNKEYFKGINGFTNPVDIEYFQELLIRYPNDERLQDIVEDLQSSGEITKLNSPLRSLIGVRPVVTPKKNQFFGSNN